MSADQMRPIDFRSDTLTMPSEGMREAMAAATIGDDVFGEDPTINELQRRAAEISGKQAALFVASGTMANLTSLLAQTRSGDELLVGRLAHIVRSEAGGISRLGGVLATILEQQPDGGVDPDAVAAAVRTDDIHQPRTTLLALENTHNFCGGTVLSLERMRDLANVAHQHGLRVHVDGARIFNAAVASGHAVEQLCADVDSVSFCLSKGLGAPVGSLICGDQPFIDECRRVRKLVGGGWREAGMLAAAGLYALDHNVARLADDHNNARALARGLAELGYPIRTDDVQTNIVIFPLAPTAEQPNPAGELSRRLSEIGVRSSPIGRAQLRFVTHLDVDRADIDETLERITAAAITPAPETVQAAR